MVDVTPFLPGLSPVQGKAVVARFDGGRLSSEGGLLALREIESRLRLADRLAACLKDPRAPERVVHRLAEIIRSHVDDRYEDGDDADSLRADPMFKLAASWNCAKRWERAAFFGQFFQMCQAHGRPTRAAMCRRSANSG